MPVLGVVLIEVLGEEPLDAVAVHRHVERHLDDLVEERQGLALVLDVELLADAVAHHLVVAREDEDAAVHVHEVLEILEHGDGVDGADPVQVVDQDDDPGSV